jgi:hypothetical protein
VRSDLRIEQVERDALMREKCARFWATPWCDAEP